MFILPICSLVAELSRLARPQQTKEVEEVLLTSLVRRGVVGEGRGEAYIVKERQ